MTGRITPEDARPLAIRGAAGMTATEQYIRMKMGTAILAQDLRCADRGSDETHSRYFDTLLATLEANPFDIMLNAIFTV